MGRRKHRKKATRAEKIRAEIPGAGNQKNAARGQIGFEDLSPMSQRIVTDIARKQRCSKEKIVDVLNQGVTA